MTNTFGRIYGSRWVSFILNTFARFQFVCPLELEHCLLLTSSRSEGKIFLVCRPSENLFRTPVSPFMKEIFSSLVLAVKLDRSRKFRVEMGREEKNGCEGSVDGVGRSSPRRVISDRMRAVGIGQGRRCDGKIHEHCRSGSHLSIPGIGFPTLSRSPLKLPWFL